MRRAKTIKFVLEQRGFLNKFDFRIPTFLQRWGFSHLKTRSISNLAWAAEERRQYFESPELNQMLT